MKIVDLIKIIGLDKDEFIPFILLGPGQHLNNELTIYPTPKIQTNTIHCYASIIKIVLF